MRGTLPVLYPVKSGPDGCSGSKSRTCCQAGPIFPAHASLNIVRLKERIYTLPDCLRLAAVPRQPQSVKPGLKLRKARAILMRSVSKVLDYQLEAHIQMSKNSCRS